MLSVLLVFGFFISKMSGLDLIWREFLVYFVILEIDGSFFCKFYYGFLMFKSRDSSIKGFVILWISLVEYYVREGNFGLL